MYVGGLWVCVCVCECRQIYTCQLTCKCTHPCSNGLMLLTMRSRLFSAVNKTGSCAYLFPWHALRTTTTTTKSHVRVMRIIWRWCLLLPGYSTQDMNYFFSPPSFLLKQQKQSFFILTFLGFVFHVFKKCRRRSCSASSLQRWLLYLTYRTLTSLNIGSLGRERVVGQPEPSALQAAKIRQYWQFIKPPIIWKTSRFFIIRQKLTPLKIYM